MSNTHINSFEGVTETKEHLSFPVIKETPSQGEAFRNIRKEEFAFVGLWTLGSAIWGYSRGRKTMRVTGGIVAATISAFGGLYMAQYNSMLRLKGYKENRKELIKYGIISEAEDKRLVKVVKRRPIFNPQTEL
ncbi:hypothetical protein ABK040_006767 [Willaertia magna]